VGGFYYKIGVNDSSWFENVTTIQLRIYYNISNLDVPAGYDESTLRPVRYVSGSWVKLDCTSLVCTATLSDGALLFASGVDTANKYVWANLSRFSTYGVSGTTPPAEPSGGGGASPCHNECDAGERVCRDGSMYVCGDFDSDYCVEWRIFECDEGEECEDGKCVPLPCVEDWVCGEWSECEAGMQERECADWNKCGTYEMMPETERECVVEAPAEEEPAAVPVTGVGIPPEMEPAPKPALKNLVSALIILAATVIVALIFKYALARHHRK
jgi:hypothetical protein